MNGGVLENIGSCIFALDSPMFQHDSSQLTTILEKRINEPFLHLS